MKTLKSTFSMFYPLLAVCLTAVAVCLCGLVNELYTYRQSRNYYAALADKAERRDSAPGVSQTGAASEESASEEAPFRSDFGALRKNIPDIAAWIRCPDTIIDYPVVHGADNEYYLDHLPDKTRGIMGSIFLDYNNSGNFQDRNNVIYGHYVSSGEMFTILNGYMDQRFYDEHPVMELYTPDRCYLLEPFAGYVIDARYESLPISFSDEAGFARYIDEVRERSVFESDITPDGDDRIVSLCTCTSEGSETRLVISAKLSELE